MPVGVAQTVQRAAHCHDPVRCHEPVRALSCLCLRARCGERRGKQESILRRCTADARRCTRMGLSPARGCTVEPEPEHPGEPCWCGGPCPIRVHRRPSASASALNPFLLACAVTRRIGLPARLRVAIPQARPAGTLWRRSRRRVRPARIFFRRQHPMPSGPASPVVSRLPASAMPHAAKTPCTYYSARHDDAAGRQHGRTRRQRAPAPVGATPAGRWHGGKSPCTCTGRRRAQRTGRPHRCFDARSEVAGWPDGACPGRLTRCPAVRLDRCRLSRAPGDAMRGNTPCTCSEGPAGPGPLSRPSVQRDDGETRAPRRGPIDITIDNIR